MRIKLIYAITFLFCLGITQINFAQNVGINSAGASPDDSAMLDIVSTDKGVLIPRMDSTARKNISSPAEGLLVFDNSYNNFYFFNGTAWETIRGNAGDDLGNHSASQDLIIGSHSIRRSSGTTSGIHIDAVTRAVFESTSTVPAQFKSNAADSNGSFSSYIEINNSAGTRALFGVDGNGFSGGDTTDVVLANWSNGGLNLFTNAIERMRIQADGKVGIGEDAPSSKLHVDGDIRAVSPGTAIQSIGANGTINVAIREEYSNAGGISLYNDTGAERLAQFIDTNSDGAALFTYGPTSSNFLVGNLSGYNDNGFIAVADSVGSPSAGMYIDASGNGIIYGNTKSFRVDHPKDPDKEIWYACIEGPEAAAYIRGSASLEDGKATVLFPEHFALIANIETLTLTLTPTSADSRGLAVVRKTENGFEVQELMNGTGSYDFDWVAMAVRKGKENFEVIREKRVLAAPTRKRKDQSGSK